jgi:cell division protein FtsZ
MADLTRPVSVVPQILDAPIQSQARGFTEVKIVGVGGGGGNAVNRMVEAGVQGVEFIAVNTDAQALQMSAATHKLVMGGRNGRGLGAGGSPDQGERAAEISRDQISELLAGADMVFLTAGMGGGTGTGAAPVIADIARSQHALTVAVVTLPFGFEGPRRGRTAREGLEKLRSQVDALIVIPNDRLLNLADRQTSVVEAFHLADDVLRQGVQGISDLVTMTGLINLDFADVKTVMHNAGTALMAIGEGKGEGRAMVAARAAIASPMLDVSIEGATGVLLNISGGPDMSLAEVTEAAEAIADAVDPEANIILGTVIHPRMQDEIKITIIATGLRDAGRQDTNAWDQRNRGPRRPTTPPSSQPIRRNPTFEPEPPDPTPFRSPRDRSPQPPEPRRRERPPLFTNEPRPAREDEDRDRDLDQPPSQSPSRWQRFRERSTERFRPHDEERRTPPADDDYDTPTFQRRPR